MASWTDIRDAIIAVLENVEITDPALVFTDRVYATPPKAVRDVPCFIIIPPAVVTVRGSGARDDTYSIRCICLVKDADLHQAMEMVDKIREALLDAFDLDVKLGTGTGLGVLIGQSVDEAGDIEYGGVHYSGFNSTLTVRARPDRQFVA